MKQAIQEGFILDVLGNHTTVDSYFGLVKKIDDDPEFDSKRAQRRLRRYVEGHDYAVAIKAQIMVDHFHESVFPAPQDRRPRPRDGRHRRRGPRHRLPPRHQCLHQGKRLPIPVNHRLLGGPATPRPNRE